MYLGDELDMMTARWSAVMKTQKVGILEDIRIRTTCPRNVRTSYTISNASRWLEYDVQKTQWGSVSVAR